MDTGRGQTTIGAHTERATGETPIVTAAATPAAAASSPRRATTPLRILLAEDNPANQEMVMCVLQSRGHNVTVANNGREAVAAVQRSHFDIVLMDVHMPEMDGHEAAATIRASEAGGALHVPIVAMTADALADDRARCLASGMDDYVPKPSPPRVLLETIARCLEKVSATATRAGGMTEGAQL